MKTIFIYSLSILFFMIHVITTPNKNVQKQKNSQPQDTAKQNELKCSNKLTEGLLMLDGSWPDIAYGIDTSVAFSGVNFSMNSNALINFGTFKYTSYLKNWNYRENKYNINTITALPNNDTIKLKLEQSDDRQWKDKCDTCLRSGKIIKLYLKIHIEEYNIDRYISFEFYKTKEQSTLDFMSDSLPYKLLDVCYR